MFIYMPINALFPLMSMNYFEGSTLHASVVEIVFAVGMLFGRTSIGRMGRFQKAHGKYHRLYLSYGSVIDCFRLATNQWFYDIVICCTLMGFSAPFYNGVQTALFQEQIQPEYLGRVFGLSWQHHVVCHAAWVGSVGCHLQTKSG